MKYLPLFLLLCLALAVRLINLNALRLTHDEMSIGYNAYSILRTGQDEWGQTWPLTFKAFGDQKLPVYIYAVVPAVALFGLTPLAVKLPSIVAGVGLVLGIYWLVKRTLKQKTLALAAALLMAVSPWPVHLSRLALESNLALLFFVLSLNLIVDQLQTSRQTGWRSLLAGGLLALTCHTYVAYRLIVAGLAGWLLIAWMASPAKRRTFSLILVGVVVGLSPFLFQLGRTAAMARWWQLSFTQNEGVNAAITEKQLFCFIVDPGWLSKACRRVYVYPFELTQRLVKQYLAAVSPEYLFFQGDQLVYLQDPGFGQLAWILAPFYLLGLAGWLKRRDKTSRLLLISFLLAPLPAALVGVPQAVRLSALLPSVILLTVFGLKSAIQLTVHPAVKKVLTALSGTIFLFLTDYHLLHYWFVYPHQHRAAFYPMGTEAAQYVLERQDSYRTIYITEDFADAHILLAFVGRLDPDWYRAQVVRPTADNLGFSHPVKLGRFHFGRRQGDVFLNDPQSSGVLYLSGPTDDLATTHTFTSYSGVHAEVNVTDIDQLRSLLKQAQSTTDDG